eukprot:667426-Amphidinium_carterae.1
MHYIFNSPKFYYVIISVGRVSVVKASQAIQSGHRQPKGRHRDLEVRAGNGETPFLRIASLIGVKLTLTSPVVLSMKEADEVANLVAAAHSEHEPSEKYLRWTVVAQAVRLFWLLVGPKLRERPEAWPRARHTLKDHTGVWSTSTPLPGAWTVTGRR